LDTLKIATIAIGETSLTSFQERVSCYVEAEHFQLPAQASAQQINSVVRELKNYNLVIACLHSNQIAPGKKYGLTDIQITAAEQIMARENAIFIAFTNAYAIKFISGIEKSKAIIAAYGNHRLLQDFTAQLVFGSIGANGTLPVSIDRRFNSGDGIATSPIGRLQYTSPEEAGIQSERIEQQIDSTINKAIRDRFFPGCQVLLARQGKVYFSKAYGYQTFDSLVQVTSETLYDWASITKIVGPLPLLMKMTEDSLIDLYRPFSEYWPDFKGTNKERITLHDILTHQAGLQPGLHFHAQLLKKDFKYNDRLVQDHPSEKFQVRISPDLYIHNSFKDSVFAKIRDSDLLKKKGYAYSDLGFLLFPKIISEIYGESFEQLLYPLIYKPLGTKALYNPYLKHPVDRCAPTENDYLFRKTTVFGYVHDESAAVLGGVSGNAGLFGSANDLAIIMQMYLQKGHYGAQRYIQEKTVELFTRKQHPGTENRRALGFDKPVSDHRNQSIQKVNIAPFASERSFGHTGFTGTAVWADPEDQVLFIFLTNRTYPNRSTNMINNNFRVKLQQMIYELQGTFVVPKL
jgi:CubicO group peptidase (beta-lactamase class C family)